MARTRINDQHDWAFADTRRFPQFPFTNDPAMGAQRDALLEFRRQVATDVRRVAVLVGTGGLLSLADALPQVVYITDQEQLLLDWVAQTVGTMAKESTPQHYLKGMGLHSDDMPKGERRSFGRAHFMHSAERYAQCQVALAAKTIHYVKMNYIEPADVREFGDLLRGGSQVIDTFNATNMHNHIAKSDIPAYLENLQTLTWADPSRIVCSRFGMNASLVPPLPSLEQYSWITES